MDALRHSGHRAALFIGALILLAVLGIALGAGRYVGYAEEDVLFAFSPSAERAFTFGERHFDAESPELYDIDRASYFFEKSALLGGHIQYLEHERARVEFLRGHLNTALALIDIQIQAYGDKTPNSYYIRGLIEGYMGRYDDAIRDYSHYLQMSPGNWAAVNDYAWVLLKAGRSQDAAFITGQGIDFFPNNPWLLNTHATALYDLKDYAGALASVQKASVAVQKVSESDWLHAYPGNDPHVASQGVASFKSAVAENMHTIQLAIASGTVQSR